MAVGRNVEPGVERCHFCCAESSNCDLEVKPWFLKLVERSRKGSEHLQSVMELEWENLKLFKAPLVGIAPLRGPRTDSAFFAKHFPAFSPPLFRSTVNPHADTHFDASMTEFGSGGIETANLGYVDGAHVGANTGGRSAMLVVAVPSADGSGSPISSLELLLYSAARVAAPPTFLECTA